MVGELEVPIIAAGSAAFVAIDDFEQIPVQTSLIRPEPLDQLGDVQDRLAPAYEAADGQACAHRELAA
ncbi:MAG: hypothetical protein EOR60_03665 [Mesorhizobium sp.]|nr:MAG: hypothetical protein EOR60_03665 [Mesorhizobium sp.]